MESGTKTDVDNNNSNPVEEKLSAELKQLKEEQQKVANHIRALKKDNENKKNEAEIKKQVEILNSLKEQVDKKTKEL